MKGDFTRFTHRPEKHYTRVLKQQGRVDLDADWNEWVEIVTHLERTEAIDVIGRCGAPIHGGGFEVEETADGSNLTISRGRIYVDGILCSNEPAEPEEDASPPAEPIPIDQQEDLPGYAPDGSPPLADGVYLAYLDVWDRHVTHLEDPEIREPALGGPDTTTRTRTVCQVKLHPLDVDAPVDTLECEPYPAPPADGRLAAWAEPAEESPNPCEVPAGAGYRGLENRLYRVEIHRGSEAGPPTFKWSRDNGSVVLPVAEGGIDDKKVTLAHLGPDKVLTVAVGDWVEVSGDETELHGRPGTLAKVTKLDEADLRITLSAGVSAHAGEGHLKVRRWDMEPAAGALPLQSDVELEDGVRVGFDLGATYHTGDYWVIPARTRLGAVLWPEEEDGGSPPAPKSLRRFGIEHHYCTLALVRRKDSKWTQSRDCRPSFPPLTEIDRGCCCVTVEPGESVRDAVATVVAAGGGCVSLCQGVHRVDGPLWLHHAHDVTIAGVGTATVLRFAGVDEDGFGGFVIESGQRIAIEDLFVLSGDAPALVTVRHDEELRLSREIALRRLTMLNPSGVGIQLAHADGVTIEECRIVAAAGIVGLWGNAATAVGSPPDDAVRVDFEDLAVGQRFSVGDVFTSSGVEIRGEPFTWGNNQTTSGGFTEVEDGGRAGGSGHDLEVNNINLGFGLATPVASLSLAFGEYGGNENLRINGEFRNVSDLDDLDGVIVGGVGVQVTRTDDLGTLRLDEVTQPIGDFAIGGQELWIDDVTFGAPSRLRQELLGDGVSRLEMRDSTIRYLRAGVLSVLSDRWRITRCDVQAPEEKVRGRLFKLDLETFGDRPAGAGAVRSRDLYAKILEVLEELLAAPGPEKGSPDAVLALLWRDCAIRWSRLGEVYAWWWIRGEARGNRIAGRRRGLSAFWLHDADWRDNRITCCYGKDLAVESFLSREDETLRLHPERSVGGPALSFAGSYQASIAGNRTRGGLGVLKLSLREALKDLADPVDLAARVYGAGSKAGREDGSELEQVLRRWLEDGAALTGLAPLIAGAQEVTDALYDLAQHEEVRAALEEQGRTPPFQQGPPGPLLASLARQLSGWLFARRQTLEQTKEPAWVRWGALLPVIALTVARNRMASHADTVLMERFLTFGGLRIEDNRLDSANGQTIRVDAWPYSANVSVVVVILRYLLDALGDVAEQVGDFGDFSANLTGDLKTSFDDFVAALGKLAAAVAKQAEDWQRRLEPSLGTDYRIAGNTLRSLDTAIESNLFELAVEGNHVTMVERPVSNAVVVETIEALAEESEHLEAVVMLAQDGDVNALAYADQAQWKDPNQVDFYLDDAQLYGRAGLEYTYDAPPAAPAAGTAPAVTETGGQKQAAVELNWATWHEDVVDDGKVYHQAVEANDVPLARATYGKLRRRLEAALNSYGIWTKGAGCRIVDNHVLVPGDLDPETQARGGIRLQGDEEVNRVIVLLALLDTMESLGFFSELLPDFGPLLSVTETVVEDNEVIGGVGAGIDVRETSGYKQLEEGIEIGDAFGAGVDLTPIPEDGGGFQVLFDLQVRGNQVRDMAGAGLAIDRGSLAVNVEVADNRFLDCGGDAARQYLGFTEGGVAISHAVFCRLSGNQVVRCGNGVFLDHVFNLDLSDNHVLRNGGGVFLYQVRGSVTLRDNELLYNQGLALGWYNHELQFDEAVLGLILLALAYLRPPLVQGEDLAAITDNVLHAGPAADPAFGTFGTGVSYHGYAYTDLNLYMTGSMIPGFAYLEPPSLFWLDLAGMPLTFDANTCHGQVGPLGWIHNLDPGVITGNLFRFDQDITPLWIANMASGVITSNVSGNSNPILVTGSSGVRHGFNVPDIGPDPIP